MIELLVKRGDTFSREVAAFADDVPQDLTTATVRCHVRRGPLVRDAGTLIQELTVTLDPPPAVGVFTIFASAAQTATWPLGRHLSDIEITIGAGVQSTETFAVIVLEDITR